MKVTTTITVLLLCIGGIFSVGVYTGSRRGIPFVHRKDQWSIAIYRGPSLTHLQAPEDVQNPVLTAADVTDVPAFLVSDPFMIRRDNTWYMFFEVWNTRTDEGDIAFATSLDARKWTYGHVVLNEPYHLSYPYVFERQGQVYMMPESMENRAVTLYRATQFPDHFEQLAVLLEGAFTDSCLFEHRGRFYLFTSTFANNTLVLYHADSLTGPYTKHPQNPLVIGNAHIARGGGRIIHDRDGRMYRLAQDDDPSYGVQVHLLEILELSATAYRERRLSPAPILGPSGHGWNAAGMHTVDAHQLADGSWLAAVDGHRQVYVTGWGY